MSEQLPLADRHSRLRIETDLGCNMLVEAGAGSGKTHEMAARMAAGIATGTYQLEHMAAVTFTRKAAAELRGRFQLALEAELAGSTDAARSDRVRAALSGLERFFAGTIHAFCARLLRERPIEARVSPGFTELDDVEDRVLRGQSWRDYRAQARALGDPDLALLNDAGIKAGDLDKAFEVVSTYEDVTFPAEDLPLPDGTEAWKALERFWASLAPYLPAFDDASTCRTQLAAEKFKWDWLLTTGERRTAARLADLLECWSGDIKVVQKYWSADRKEAKRISEEVGALTGTFVEEVVTPYLDAWRQYLYAPCIRVLTKAREHAAAERRRRNVMSFNDLLLLSARMLRDHPSVRRALQQKYRHLFVDEFQDTDPVQAEIMLLLASDDDAVRAGAEPSLRPGSLFVVGDPKQSIYRFRRADISTYNDVRRLVGGEDQSGIVALTTNFRSVPALCAWANDVFDRTFPAVADDWQPRFAALVPSRAAGDGPVIRTISIPADVSASDVCAAEAERIARYIRAAVDSGRRYQDFLILTRKKKRLFAFAHALEALQIPLEVSGAGAFGESEHVRELGTLLAALADPQDSVTLVGVLRGLLFGLSDQQLFEYRKAGGYFGLFSELEQVPDAARPVADALTSLRRWYRWTRMLPAGAALDLVLEDSGCLAWAASSPGGVDAGDLLHAIDRVRGAVEVGFTLAEAAEALGEADRESTEVESLPLEPGRRDVVRVMNLHKAKGLEAPVVFLVDPLGGYEPEAEVHVRRTAEGGGVGWFEIFKKYGEYGKKVLAVPAGWAEYEAAERRYLDAEASRLLYVAATRARDMLVIGRHLKPASPSRRAWHAFDPYLTSAVELDVPASVDPPAPVRVDLSAKAARKAADTRAAAHDAVAAASWAAVSVTAEIKHLPRIVPVHEQADEDDPTRVLTAETPSRRADAGMGWGTLVHGLLEHAMRHRSATREDLRRLAVWLTVEEPDLRQVIDRALDTVEAVARAPFWQEAGRAGECHQEVPFGLMDPGGDVPRVVSGVMDLVYRAEDGWQLLDYKTDVNNAPATLEAKYAVQIAAYEQAWERFTGAKPSTSIIGVRRE